MAKNFFRDEGSDAEKLLNSDSDGYSQLGTAIHRNSSGAAQHNISRMNGIEESVNVDVITGVNPHNPNFDETSEVFANERKFSSATDSDSDNGAGEDDSGYRRRRRQRQQENSRINGGDDPPDKVNMSFRSILKNITIEPMMFAHMFGATTTSVVLQNLYIERICKNSLGYNDTVCAAPSDFKWGNETVETQLDEIASKYVTYRSVIETGFPIVFSLFLGPWTDVHGTKWTMLLPIFGYFLSAMCYLTFTFLPEIRPELLLISSIPITLVGGLVALIMSSFSFIAKGTTPENRSFRVAMVEASWFLGSPLGTLTGGLVYSWGHFPAVFCTSGALFLAAFLYGVVAIREEPTDIEGRGNCCADMFNVKAVKDMFGTVFQRRSGKQRRWLLIMLFAISLRILALFGYMQNMYLYTRKRLQWDVKQYTQYSMADSFIAIAGGYVMIMVFMRIFKVSDAVIGAISTVGPFMSQFVFAFVEWGWMMYFGSCVQMFGGLISIVLRSMISKVVAKDEIARVYTFLACSEATMPLLGVPLYSYIFRHTLQTFAGTMFMVSAGAYLIIVVCFVYLHFSMKKEVNHVQLDDSTESSA